MSIMFPDQGDGGEDRMTKALNSCVILAAVGVIVVLLLVWKIAAKWL